MAEQHGSYNEGSGRTIDPFDYQYGQIADLPDAVKTQESIVRTTVPLIGVAETFIVQTIRRSGVGDTIFLECAGAGRIVRLVLPPKVADVIARQRDALTTMARRNHGRRVAQERQARGEKPGFMRTHARTRKGK